MATTSYNLQNEGASTSRPPFFDGNDYAYWKARMTIYLQSIDFDLWLSIENGPHRPLKTENGIEIPKSMIEYTDLDKRLLSMDAKAMNTLYCALNRSEFNRISSCKNARDIWHTLEVTHEGTNQVKESKIDMLVHQYELFKMLQNESITSMFTRMTSITNNLHALGRTYTNTEIVSKILRSLPKAWEAKVTAIREAKDLTKLPLEELIGSLMTHEITMEKQDQEERPKKNLAFKTVHQVEDKDNGDDEDSDDDLVEDVALITREFRNFLRKKNDKRKFSNYRKEGNKGESSKETPRCYKCNKVGHIKTDCPLLQMKKKNRFQKKVLKATWSDDSDSSSNDEEEHVANMCFMAIESENEVQSSDDESDPSYIELYEQLENLYVEYKKLGSKYSTLKRNHICLIEEKELLEKKVYDLNDKSSKTNQLEKDNKSLKEKVDELNLIITKFTQGSKFFEKMLSSQRSVFNKGGLGYKPNKNQKYLKNYFVKAKESYDPSHTCNYCRKLGHLIYACPIKKNKIVDMIWVPKGTTPNQKGPKKVWVPKSSS